MPRVFLVFFLVARVCCFAQSADSTSASDTTTLLTVDTTAIVDSEEEIVYRAKPDTSVVQSHVFDKRKIDELKKDSDFNYELPPTVAETLWDRFLKWLGQLMEDFFDGAVQTNWGRVITYVIGLALLVVLIMLMLKVNAFRVIYSAEGGSKKYNVFNENIHEMDFDSLVNEAISEKDFRKAIRLLFLYALRVLSEKQLIQWQAGKTNHDYVAELSGGELKKGLNELSFYFEYAWYGNFEITEEMFGKVQDRFSEWKDKIR